MHRPPPRAVHQLPSRQAGKGLAWLLPAGLHCTALCCAAPRAGVAPLRHAGGDSSALHARRQGEAGEARQRGARAAGQGTAGTHGAGYGGLGRGIARAAGGRSLAQPLQRAAVLYCTARTTLPFRRPKCRPGCADGWMDGSLPAAGSPHRCAAADRRDLRGRRRRQRRRRSAAKHGAAAGPAVRRAGFVLASTKVTPSWSVGGVCVCRSAFWCACVCGIRLVARTVCQAAAGVHACRRDAALRRSAVSWLCQGHRLAAA